jgi:catechol 2,3-dioxygenase-like lactoylglutathione lyase family enzyme
MSTFESFRRQARQLVRWHREGNYSVGGRIRLLPRYRELTDAAALALRFPLAEAQEIIARENGYESWAALKNATAAGQGDVATGQDDVKIIKVVRSQEARGSRPAAPGAQANDSSPEPPELASEESAPGKPVLKTATPILFVSNVQASAEFFRDKLGFAVDFLHGHPPFYGAVSRDGARLHLRFVHEPAFAQGIVEREQLLAAYIDVADVKALFAEYLAAGVPIHTRLKREPWGGCGFTILDLDGNRVYFGE